MKRPSVFFFFLLLLKSGGFGACCVWGDSTRSEAPVIHRALSSEGGAGSLFVYPCCNDNDVMNGERERESGRKDRDFKANAWGDVRQTCICVITTEVKMLHRH